MWPIAKCDRSHFVALKDLRDMGGERVRRWPEGNTWLRRGELTLRSSYSSRVSETHAVIVSILQPPALLSIVFARLLCGICRRGVNCGCCDMCEGMFRVDRTKKREMINSGMC